MRTRARRAGAWWSRSPSTRLPGRGLFAAAAACALAAGCTRLSGTASVPPAEARFLAEGLDALELGDFDGAEDRFRRLAYRCEAGPSGRKALVLLATVELDARNEGGRPDEAARLAATFLNLPAAPAEERAVARTLYLAALDRGAAPVRDTADLRDPAAASERAATEGPVPARLLPPARRFTDCGAGPPPFSGVPELSRLAAAEALRRAEGSGVAERQRADSLRARVEALEAELARIRKLLRGGGGGGGREGPHEGGGGRP